jgi:hypothetical protein
LLYLVGRNPHGRRHSETVIGEYAGLSLMRSFGEWVSERWKI